jgi:hypothetical protein
MRRLPLILFMLGMTAAVPAAAHDAQFQRLRPYAIEKDCNQRNLDCKARMRYAPGENPGLAGSGSYWFAQALGYVRVTSDRHVHWCLANYRTYDPGTDTFIGKRHRAYRCNSPYDGG